MALKSDDSDKANKIIDQDPAVNIFLRPIAPPAALGLAAFAGSTWITASWIAEWWGSADSPTIFFPFVAFWGGLAQFIAGLFGYAARDCLVTVVHCLWGSFWMSIGLLYLLVQPAYYQLIASGGAIAALARDVALAATLFFLAIGSTIACCLYAYDEPSVRYGMKAAAYFWIFSSICAWWRVTNYLVEEAFGSNHIVAKCFTVFTLPTEKNRSLLIAPGVGEPGVKRGKPGPQ